MPKNTNKKLEIYKGISATDWFSFNQIYMPLLSKEGTQLFMNLIFQKQLNDQIKIENYDFHKFLKNYRLTEKEFNTLFAELESLDLVKATYKSSIDNIPELLIKIETVKSVKEALNDIKINSLLKKQLSKNKYTELQLSIEEPIFEFEINIPTQKQQQIEEENIIDKRTYCEFYDGVLKLLNSEFSVSNEIIETIREYHIDKKNITMKQLQTFAYMSAIKNEKNKYEISLDNFLFLIENKTNEKNIEITSIDKYKKFWQKIKIMPIEKLVQEFNTLFQHHNSSQLYMLLTEKHKVPESLNKWQKECIQEKNFNFPLINGIMSFVMSLLKKIPISYLSKVSDTLHDNYATTPKGLIELVRNVIDNDLSKGKNRLQAHLTEENLELKDAFIV